MPASYLKSLKNLEKRLNYNFRDINLLVEALTHTSFSNEAPNEHIPHNERLEFLGDAVLGLAVVEELYRAKEGMKESEMAKLKAFLVSKSVLARVAKDIKLGRYLRLGKGEDASGGRQKENILADAMEAVFGAVFLDSNYEKAKDVISRLMRKRLDSTIRTGHAHDYKTELQELTQQLHGSLPEYRTIKEEGQEHNKEFTVAVYVNGKRLGRGKGKSKKEAQMKAARGALRKLKGTSH